MIKEKLKDKEKLKENFLNWEIDQKKDINKEIEPNYVDEQDQIYSFTQAFLNKINQASDLKNLEKKFIEATDQNCVFKSFGDKINKMKHNLSNINDILSRSYSNSILDKLIDSFVFKNRLVFKNLDNNLYNKDFIKTQVLNITDSREIMFDIIKTYLTKQETKVASFQIFDNKLKEWLVNCICEDKNKDKDKLTSGNIENKLYRDVAYLGFDYNFFAKIRRFNDQKKLVEKHRRLEICELDRKYGSDFRRVNNYSLENFEKSGNLLESERNLKDKDLKLNFNDCRYYEDKIYRSVNVFYNQKYNKIDEQQKQLIDEYRLNLADLDDHHRQREIKKYIKESVREEYKIDLISDLSLNIKQDYKISDIDYIFKFTANKAKDFIFSLSSNKKSLEKTSFDLINQRSGNMVKKDMNLNKKNLVENFFRIKSFIKSGFESKDEKSDNYGVNKIIDN